MTAALIPLASISDKVLEPIIELATEFIGSAGVAKMPFWRFSAYTLLGSIPWVLALALIGEAVGHNWKDWRHKLGYLDYAVLAAIVIGGIFLLLKRRRTTPDNPEPARSR
jgi:membrane protein DedA with SNARE-associated domain